MRKDYILIPFIGIGGYMWYRGLITIGKELMTNKDDDFINNAPREYVNVFKDILRDRGIDLDDVLTGDYILSLEEEEKIARVYYLRTGRNIYKDLLNEEE